MKILFIHIALNASVKNSFSYVIVFNKLFWTLPTTTATEDSRPYKNKK